MDYLWLAVISETSDDLRKLHKFSVFHGYSVRGHKHARLRKLEFLSLSSTGQWRESLHVQTGLPTPPYGRIILGFPSAHVNIATVTRNSKGK